MLGRVRMRDGWGVGGVTASGGHLGASLSQG
jgi:hypothetical protein